MKRLLENKVFKNFTYLAAIQVFTYLTPLIVIPHLYKTIGVQKYGLFAFTNSFVFYFIILVDFGFQLYATKEVAANRDDRDYINRLFTSVYIVKLLILAVVSILYFSIISISPFFEEDNIIYHYAFLQVIGFFFLPIWLFQGYENIRPLTIINAIFRISFLAGVIILVRHQENYKIVQLLNSGSILLYGLVSFLLGKKIFNVRFVPINRLLALEVVRKSAWYFGARVATSLYTVSNTIFLGIATNNYNVGVYSVAERFYFAIQNLLQPVTSAIYPHISSTKDIRPIKKYLVPSMLIFTLLCLVAALLADYVFLLLIKNIQPESIAIFRILCIVLVVTFPSLLLGYPVTAALGHDRMANVPIFIISAFHIASLGMLHFMGYLSPINVAVLLLVTEVGLLAIRVFIIRHLRIF